MMSSDGTMAADKTINLNPTTSVLRLRVGDEIRLSEADFAQLSRAFFPAIARKFLAWASQTA
jgi:hypothetical protein